MRDDRFEWDDDKARANLAKHKISFEDAKHVFDTRNVNDDPDLTMDYDEDRFTMVGLVNGRLLAVLYTLRGERRRIISARLATRTEGREYAKKFTPK
jgi:uncharacterized protein